MTAIDLEAKLKELGTSPIAWAQLKPTQRREIIRKLKEQG